MAIIRSSITSGKVTAPYPPHAGQATVQLARISVPSTLAVGDILDVGILPAMCRLFDLVVATDNVGFTAGIGLVSGGVGSTDSSRTCNDVFFTALSLTAGIKRLSKPSALNVGSSDRDRSIGIVMTGGTVTAGTITLIATYAAP